ncbi:F-box protein [Carex littledalei]|uniref:F-box protein n=1 Tax=Carex littledalei TaxID=544730 RepID=A0A833RFX9_9POAL|nr:F-box protein [Carex littledalei]
MGPDWYLLPPELHKAIGEKVTSLADYIRFRAVCRPWRSACSPRPNHLPLQLPWLMLPYQSDGNDDSIRLFYDLSASKIHKLDLPETRGASICGSSHGWLVLQKDQVVSLLNPITRATIPLPPFTGPPFNIGIAPLHASNDDELFFAIWEADKYTINLSDNFMVWKAILTSSPLDPSCMVFVFTGSKWQLAFCKIGDECWTVIEFECNFPSEWDICDFTYSNGFLYTVDPSATVTMYNLNNSSKTLLGRGIGLNDMYLVDGVSGDILLIYHDGPTYDVDGVLQKKTEYKVYKFSNDGEPKWIEVIDVGQHVLFLGGDYHALSLSSTKFQLPEWGANCLCYDSVRIEQWNRQDSWASWYNHNIKLARLDDGTATDIAGDLGSFQVNRHWQKSLWLTPSLL